MEMYPKRYLKNISHIGPVILVKKSFECDHLEFRIMTILAVFHSPTGSNQPSSFGREVFESANGRTSDDRRRTTDGRRSLPILKALLEPSAQGSYKFVRKVL